MSKFLVIAEKPSVAQSYAKNLSAYKREDGYLEGESCIVSWCLGHLAEYAQPEEYDPKYEKWQFDDLPILPEVWKLKVSKDKKKQFDVLKGLMNRSDVEYLVNGCDAGREGELIFQRVYDLAGCRKPVKRLWISSMEDAAIQKGFQTMKSEEEYKNLCMAAVCRAQADWLIGMNGTRAYTTRYFKRLVVGRVQTPTLAMLAERQERIEHFQKEAFYKVALTDGKLTVVSENIANEEAADLLAALCNGSTAVVTQMKKERKKSFPPKLYDLTSLQREANRYFGYTAKRTLDMLQELYEEKLVTYPRTDSQFVTEDMKDSVEELVGKMPVLLPFVDYGQLGHDIKRVINNAKVSDHHAILPTKEAVEKGIADLPADKKNLMMLICQQLVQATGEEYLYEQTDITVKCQEHDFKARGKISVQMGFKEVEKAFKQLCVKAEPVEGKEKETSIPAGYEEGMRLFPVKAEKTTHYTSPPKPFNEDTLLAAMETAGNKEFDSETEKKGLGTPATRASIIEKLVSSGYAQRKGKQILPSIEGKELVKVMPEYLKSAVMTAEWENQLLMMEKGQITDTQFMGEITSLVRKILEVCREIPEEERRRFQTAREVIEKLRKEIPEVIIRTTVMVGFPGETTEDFDELYEFIQETKFDKMGAFSYSKEENTPAEKLKEQIHPATKKSRYNKIMQLQKKLIEQKKYAEMLEVLKKVTSKNETKIKSFLSMDFHFSLW